MIYYVHSNNIYYPSSGSQSTLNNNLSLLDQHYAQIYKPDFLKFGIDQSSKISVTFNIGKNHESHRA